jgi:hypothetical protein
MPPGKAAQEKGKNMNADYRLVPTRFGPETGFEVKPVPPGPFRARQENELERLKARLLSERLEALGDPQVGRLAGSRLCERMSLRFARANDSSQWLRITSSGLDVGYRMFIH